MDKALLAELFKKNKAGATPILLRITHPEMMTPLYLTDNNEALVYDNNTYVPAYFNITLPEQSKDSVGLAKLTIGAVDLTIIDMIRNLQTPLKVKFMAEYYKDGIFSRLDSFEFSLVNVTWNVITLQGDLGFQSMLDYDFPSGEFSTITTPGIA
jgi:hypothetical protein